ncbi:MAG: hypothetical protein GVY25_13860 [Bacteroidetes bacterium]|nr:hypothetical protein [Bacteroidota bacterium]
MSDHDVYLERRDFRPESSLRIFDPDERRDLKRYGHWLQALADGTIEPESEDQERFVELIQKAPTSPTSGGATSGESSGRRARRNGEETVSRRESVKGGRGERFNASTS